MKYQNWYPCVHVLLKITPVQLKPEAHWVHTIQDRLLSLWNHHAFPLSLIQTKTCNIDGKQWSCWPYKRICIGRFWELCSQYLGIVLAISLSRYGLDINHHIWLLRISRGQHLKNYKIHATNNDHSCPLIDTGGIAPWFKCYGKQLIYTGSLSRSGKAIRAFPRTFARSRKTTIEKQHWNPFYPAGLAINQVNGNCLLRHHSQYWWSGCDHALSLQWPGLYSRLGLKSCLHHFHNLM